MRNPRVTSNYCYEIVNTLLHSNGYCPYVNNGLCNKLHIAPIVACGFHIIYIFKNNQLRKKHDENISYYKDRFQKTQTVIKQMQENANISTKQHSLPHVIGTLHRFKHSFPQTEKLTIGYFFAPNATFIATQHTSPTYYTPNI